MKRVLSVLLAAVLCVGMLTGCGGKPEDVSQDVYDLGMIVKLLMMASYLHIYVCHQAM